MSKKRWLFVIAFLLFSLSASIDVYAAGENSLEPYVEDMMEEANLPGVMVTIVQDGKKPVYIEKGYKNIEKKEMVTENTLFELGSNSKAFTGLGLLYLEQRGKISLEDSVSDYLPWFQLKYKGKVQEVKVKDLLYHTSGVNSSTIGILKPDNGSDALNSAIKDLTNYEIISEPGTSFLYATMNYDCIGLLIETVTGKSYEQFMNETLFPMYGMTDTYAGKKEPGKDKRVATGYKTGLFGNVVYQAPIYRGNTPAGYIVSDGNDMAKWLEVQLEAAMKKNTMDKIVAKSQVRDTRVEPLIVEPYSNGFQYGVGWMVFEDGIISHGGNNPDYSSYIIINGKGGYAVSVLCNRDSSYTYGIAKGISDLLLGKKPAKAPADIFCQIITISRIGLILINGLLVWAVILLIRRVIYIRKNKYSIVKLANQNKKKLFVRGAVMIFILAVPAVFIQLSMYSLYFLSVWVPVCMMAFLGEAVVLVILTFVNRMLHIISPKGGTM